MRCRRRPQSGAQAKCAEETMKKSLLTVGVAATYWSSVNSRVWRPSTMIPGGTLA
jgi:hypothetical protein